VLAAILDFMGRSRGWLLSLVVLAFVCARITGAHLHLCFDGGEPSLELHTTDSAHLDHHDGNQNHDDVDVDPVSYALAKHAKYDVSEPALIVVTSRLEAAPASSPAIAYHGAHTPRAPPRFLRPPLRAPPLPAIFC